jgi:hypothetical protein
MNGLDCIRDNSEHAKLVSPSLLVAFCKVLLPVALSVAGVVFLGRLFILPEDRSIPNPAPAINHSASHAPVVSDYPADPLPRKPGITTTRQQAKANIARSAPDSSRAISVTPPQQIIVELLWLLDQPYNDTTASRFQSLLTQLANQGDAAVPMIRDFLLSGEDQTLPADGTFRYPSLRLGLIDVLQRAGGEEAQLVSLELLQTEISAQEFVALSGYLEKQDPGFYQTEIHQAGRQLLLAQIAGLESVELGPVYQLLAEAGATSVAELNQAPEQLQHYASVALALLPDGTGLPALLDELQGSDLIFDDQLDFLKLKLLAQLAVDQPAAAATLADLASHNLIPERLWPEIAAIAGGLERIQLSNNGGAVVSRHQISSPYGDQVVYRSRTGGPRDAAEALARLQIVENLYQVAPGDAARQALASVFDRLAGS